ncbi:Uma2 family endonuclease [Actinocrispum wychmicini]|uniref:Uma2 family endonuclease n=1 Tax=Actinocrispum wychmicini TaxID=1213861 RepID=A0A4R2K4K5_9PSEU|nr:Uma2 family endonuclease [Actinocrispum wychmicini]TCO64739.1 Uma2 family endonuclease [Actinocrispum wychmicini]
MAVEAFAPDFDPLVEFYGMWNTELAELYLPLPNVPMIGKYECLDGYLIMSPREGTPNSYATVILGSLLIEPARAAGFRAYSAVNMGFYPNRWIEPDLTVLNAPTKGLTWVPADRVLMPVEFVSPSSRRRDRLDKPALCADAGVPYFMRVEINKYDAHVELLRLDGDKYVMHAKALSGQQFETELPFPLSFDPGVLLES